MNGAQYMRGVKNSARTMVDAAPALLLAVPMVQVFVNSGSADPALAGALPNMPMVLAESACFGRSGSRMYRLGLVAWVRSLQALTPCLT